MHNSWQNSQSCSLILKVSRLLHDSRKSLKTVVLLNTISDSYTILKLYQDGKQFRKPLICWTIPFIILGVSGLYFVLLFYFFMKNLLANNIDPEQMPHYVASDLGLCCLPMSLSRVSR